MSVKSQLVTNHLEGISVDVFKKHPEAIRSLIKGNAGVYALYNNKKLYYIGLASDLMGRLNAHSKNKHRGAWDEFSVYLIRRDEHIKELESLLLRIADPRGNKTKGRFARSISLSEELRNNIQQEVENIFPSRKGSKARAKKKLKTSDNRKKKLGELALSHMTLKGQYKGRTYMASLKNGIIKYKGRIYYNPTAAATAATNRKTGITGWSFWHYKDKSGEWVKLRNAKRSTKHSVSRKQPKVIGKNTDKAETRRKRALAGLIFSQMTLKGQYKGRTYMASLKKNGDIEFNGSIYQTPSGAAKAAKGGQEANGWMFWRYKDPKSGELFPLQNLKK
ncbi:MAG: hypothetical protein ACR2PR_07660 [Pseudohongiellaceae bacterium]